MRWLVCLSLLILVACKPTHEAKQTDENYVKVNGFYGNYQAITKHIGRVATSLRQPQTVPWPLDKHYQFDKQIKIAVLFPNKESNDQYWQLVRQGIQAQADKHKFHVTLIASDSYTHLAQHQAQFIALAQQQPDAIIIGAIHFRAMDKLIKKAQQGGFGKPTPVIGVVNDLYAPYISAKVMVSFTDMGARAGTYVLEDALENQKDNIRVAFLPGPINSGWAPDSLSGFVESIRKFPGNLHLIEPQWGTPTADVQRQLLVKVLEQHNDIDYIVGNAVAAIEASKLMRVMGTQKDTKIISTYYNPALEQLIKNTSIAAAPSDQADNLGRIAVDMAAEILSGEKVGETIPFRVSPHIPIITAQFLSSDSSEN